MSDRMSKARGPALALDHGYASPRASDRLPRERTREEKAEDAKTIADNFDGQLAIVRSSVSEMQRAAAVADLDAWTVAHHGAELGLKELAHVAQAAPMVAGDTKDIAVRKRLEGAGQALDDARKLVEHAPETPPRRAPALSCADALLAVLPPDHPISPVEPVYAPAEVAVSRIFQGQFTASDIAAFRVILDVHPDHDLARRFRRFGKDRQARLLALFDIPQVKHHARAREVIRGDASADRNGQLQAKRADRELEHAQPPRKHDDAHDPTREPHPAVPEPHPAAPASTDHAAPNDTPPRTPPAAHEPHPAAPASTDRAATNDTPRRTPPDRAPPPMARRSPKLLTPEPGPRPARTLWIPDADHPARQDSDGEQVIQTSESVSPAAPFPLRPSWKSLAARSERVQIKDDSGDSLQATITYRLESRPAEIGEIPDTWIHTERRVLLRIGSGEHASATIVGQARIHLAPGEPLDPTAAIARASIGADHRGQIYLSEAGQYITLHGMGGRGSLVADAAGDDVLAYGDPLRMLLGLKRVLKQQHVAGHGGPVATMRDRGQRLRAAAPRGRAVLQREIEAIASSHDPHPSRVQAVRFLNANIADWLAESQRAGREPTEDARQLAKEHAELEQLLADLEKVELQARTRNHLDDALGAPARFLKRAGQGIGELLWTLTDAIALDANAIGGTTGLGTFDYHPRSQLFQVVAATGSSATALVLVVNSFANEWADAIERARNGDYRALTDVSIDTLMMIEGARTAGPIALAQAERLAGKLGTVAMSAHAVATSAVESGGLLVAQARNIAAAMADAADAFAVGLRDGQMSLVPAGHGAAVPMPGGLSADAIGEAARAAKQAFQDRRNQPLRMTSREPGDVGSLFDDYGEHASYRDDPPASNISHEEGHADDGGRIDEIGTAEPEKNGSLSNRRVRHIPPRTMDPRMAAEHGMGELHANRLGIARPPRHHLLPQEELKFFQKRGFPGREIDKFCVEFKDPLDHDIVHGGKQALARKHWWEHEWSTKIMKRLHEREALKRALYGDSPANNLNRSEILSIVEEERVTFGINDLRIVYYRAP